MTFRLERVHYMPKSLEPGVLYVSEEFKTAAHLCACGCGEKIRTPLRDTEWRVTETERGPTLRPSVGNWQRACKSHYLITAGEVVWSDPWSSEEIALGREREVARRQAHYNQLPAKKPGMLTAFRDWVIGLFNRN